MATRFDAIMARRGEIMLNALGMDYSVFEQSPIAFDYEGMMSAHGYSLQDIVAIQTKAGVGNTPLLELRNLTDVVRSMSAPGKGARIFVKDEAANMAGAFKDRRVGQLRRRRQQPGGALRPQVHHLPGDLRQPPHRPAGDRREEPHLRGVRR